MTRSSDERRGGDRRNCRIIELEKENITGEKKARVEKRTGTS